MPNEALFEAAKIGDVNKLREIIQSKSVNINARDPTATYGGVHDYECTQQQFRKSSSRRGEKK